MLRSLYIRNYAIIDELEIEFESGLNILTGETGAGKSIIVGALKLILGERASSDAIRSGSRKAVIEGIFDDSSLLGVTQILHDHDIPQESVLILRREVTKTHSRAYINDSPVNLSVMREAAAQLIDLHGQHEHQSLLRVSTHLDFLDAFGGLEDMRYQYQGVYHQTVQLHRELDELEERQRTLKSSRERLDYEISEIDTVNPQEGEEDQLRSDMTRLENAEQLYNISSSLYSQLYARENSTADQLVAAWNQLRDLSSIDLELQPSTDEINQAYISVKEIATLLQQYSTNVEFSPSKLDKIRDRLGDLDTLKRKYGGSLTAVMEYRKKIGHEYDTLVHHDDIHKKLEEDLTKAKESLSAMALALSQQRQEVALRIESSITAEFANLGMPAGQLNVHLQYREDPSGWITSRNSHPQPSQHYKAYRHGMDEVEFLMTTNIGEGQHPLTRIASGGEISRVMLAMKRVLAKNDNLPILVFDEIDVGISGSIARKVGKCMADLALHHQIITITHLPQIAALAHTHFVVVKQVSDGRTTTMIQKLSKEDSIEQVAQLITGAEVTDSMRQSARELMDTES
ncbi:MAG: DNA repair protein RecN [Bacteroidetes bacterium]|nr:DNA repair protein RecN [Bacteroidota bacterium]